MKHIESSRMWGQTDSEAEKLLIDARHWLKPPRPPRRITADMMMKLSTRMIDLSFEFVDWREVRDYFQMRLRATLRNIPLKPASPPNSPRTSLKDAVRIRQQPDPPPGS
jgi:hypothetical protein